MLVHMATTAKSTVMLVHMATRVKSTVMLAHMVTEANATGTRVALPMANQIQNQLAAAIMLQAK